MSLAVWEALNIPQSKIDAVHEAYALMEIFLKHHSYMACDQMTTADLSLISSVTIVGIDGYAAVAVL